MGRPSLRDRATASAAPPGREGAMPEPLGGILAPRRRRWAAAHLCGALLGALALAAPLDAARAQAAPAAGDDLAEIRAELKALHAEETARAHRIEELEHRLDAALAARGPAAAQAASPDAPPPPDGPMQ